MFFQDLIKELDAYWSSQGVILGIPYGIEVGAGTGNPNTFFRVLGPEPFSVSYVEPCRRPADGRYGENPFRLQHYFQYQIILKPAFSDHIQRYLNMLKHLGINPSEHDIRFVEDNWASPSLRAWGLGWEVWLDSMEVSQYTYFQQMGGVQLEENTVEITIGLERLAMYLQNKDDYRKLQWNKDYTYGDLFERHEYWQSKYNFEQADVSVLQNLLDTYLNEAKRLIKEKNFWVAYDYILRTSHVFNILDARGVVNVAKRREVFQEIGNNLNHIATLYLEDRKALNYPLLKNNVSYKTDDNNNDTTLDLETNINTEEVTIDFELDSEYINAVESEQNKFNKDNMFVFELEIEEYPAEVLMSIYERFSDDFVNSLLTKFGLNVKSFVKILTPQRLGIVLNEPSLVSEVKIVPGPVESVAFKDGKETQVMQKIKERYGKSFVKYEIKDGKVYFHVKVDYQLDEFVNELLNGLLKQLPFKYMTFGEYKLIRPGRSYIAFLNDRVVNLDNIVINYIGDEFETNKLYLPRWSLIATLEINSAQEYIDVIEKYKVVLEPDIREKMIVNQIRNLCPDCQMSKDYRRVLKENVMLTETPVVYKDIVDSKYLELPIELVQSILEMHQRYIMASIKNVKSGNSVVSEDLKKDGTQVVYFVVSNNPLIGAKSNVLTGAKKVSSARLDDGLFYLQTDKRSNWSVDSLREFMKKKSSEDNNDPINILNKVSKYLDILRKVLKNNGYENNSLFAFLNLFVNKYWLIDSETYLGREFSKFINLILKYYLENSIIKDSIETVDQKTKILNLLEQLYDLDSNIFDINKISLDVLLVYFSYIYTLLWNFISKYGLPKGSRDPYSIKKLTDQLIQLWYFIEEKLDQPVDLFEFVLVVDHTDNFVDYLYSRLVNNNTYFEDKTNIKAFVYTPGFSVKYKQYVSNQFANTIYENDELVLQTLKRIANLLVHQNNEFGMSYRVSYKKYIEQLHNEVHSFQGLSYIKDVDKKLYDNVLSLLGVLEEYIYLKEFSSVKQLIEQVNEYLDNVKINVEDQRLVEYRKQLLNYIYWLLSIFMNIPYLLNKV